MTFYIDTSALAKAVLGEQHSAAMLRWLRTQNDVASSDLIRVELSRVALRDGTPQVLRRSRRVLDRLTILELSEAVLERAASLQPATLRTLDAIHLASAMALGSELEAIVTYDARLAVAAEELGLPVLAPT